MNDSEDRHWTNLPEPTAPIQEYKTPWGVIVAEVITVIVLAGAVRWWVKK